MILHKTSGLAVTPERPVKNSPAQTATPAAKASATPPPGSSALPSAKPATPLSVAALVAGAGLPSDKLSASVVAFARFFSLPLKPELLTAIRRQGLATAKMPTPQAEAKTPAAAQPSPAPQLAKAATPPAALALTEPNSAREAFSLAAAAAESKGVKLTAGGLEAYAVAVDPDLRERNSGGKGGQDRRDENPDEAEKKNAGNPPLSAEGLRETVLESAEKNDLLAVMNRLPGKDGRRWIVLPFTYNSCGKELSVSMRVLIEGDAPGTSRACLMVLDIAEAEGETGKRVFVAESVNGEIHYTSVQNSGENFPCECGSCENGLLRSIDKMV
jgi:hypothetical protein